MHQIDNAVVHQGRLTLSELPFQDGQHVRVLVTASDNFRSESLSIQQVRDLLRGRVKKMPHAGEPMIAERDWESLK